MSLYAWAMKRIYKKRRKDARNPAPRQTGGTGNTGDTGNTTNNGNNGDNQGGNNDGRTDNPGDTPTVPDDQGMSLAEGSDIAITSLLQNRQQFNDILVRISIIESDLKSLDPDLPENAEKINNYNNELTQLREQERQMLDVLKGDIVTLMDIFQIGKENGGPSL